MRWVKIKLDVSDKELKNVSYQKYFKLFRDKIDFISRHTYIKFKFSLTLIRLGFLRVSFTGGGQFDTPFTFLEELI